MIREWVDDYMQLALRMERSFSKTEVSNFIDSYYGPAELKEAIYKEKIQNFSYLGKAAEDLLLRLPNQGFEIGRTEYFSKHIRALMTVAQMRSGRKFSFYELVENIFDIQPVWIPEDDFEIANQLLDQALPGRGDLRTRFHNWQENVRLKFSEGEQIVPIMQAMLNEARRRTEMILPLPTGEGVDIQSVLGVDYGAANWYQGNYRSRLELNLSRAVYLPGLLYQMCHEGYPGHHTESCLKDYHIYQEKGQLEQSLYFTFGPQLVVSEGIATIAPSLIFSPGEAADWFRDSFSTLLGPEAFDVDIEKILKAFTIATPDDLSSNLATLIEAGRKPKEVIEYAMTYTTYTLAQIEDLLPWLKSQMARLYSFTYSHGKRLIEPLLQGERRLDNIRMLLTEQITPSRIAALTREQNLRFDNPIDD